MINKIWGLLIIIGILYSLFIGNIENINNEILSSTKLAFDMTVQILPVLALWLGIMKVAESSGLLSIMSKKIELPLTKIFPEIPKGHESFGLIASNIMANMVGLGNAATPFGLKAMESLQKINPQKDTASRSMITFLVLNTSGITIIPTTIISLKILYKSNNPTDIVFPCIIASVFSVISGLLIDRFLAKRRCR